MTILHTPGVFGLLVPVFYRRARMMNDAMAREYRRRFKLPRRRGTPGMLGEVLRIGRDLLFAVWGISTLAFWLVILAGFVR